MGAFEELHQRRITGSLAMYDRMIFKGHLTALFKQDGARCYLWSQGVALKDFTPYAKATTAQIADHCRALATSAGRPVISFDHVKTRNRTQPKDDLAKSIAERDGVNEGIVCLISAVEPCYSFQVRKRMATGRLEIFRRERACLHHYLYLIDPEFGFMHIRIQGWLPYEVQVYINGREWLARALDKAGVGYVRYENSLLQIDDLAVASRLCDHFAHRAWPRLLNAFAKMVNPLLGRINAAGYGGYYWVLDQGEIATDVMFKSRPALLEVWPDLVRHAALNLSSEDVLGFLGRKLHPSLAAQVVTDAKRRPQGWRVRHRTAGNWVKVYDKASVLRVETTINNPTRVPVPACQRNRRRPARAAVVRDEKGRRRPLAQLRGRHRRQQPLPRRTGGGSTQRRRRRRVGRLVPATNQSRTKLRPVQPTHPGRLGALSGCHGGGACHHRLSQWGHRPTSLSATSARPVTRRTDDANGSLASSSNSEVTAWWPRCRAHDCIESLRTDCV